MNVIIGVGGTGAKIVEAVLNMATLGLGPNMLKVGFVDQDESNGNLNRARTVFTDYRAARKVWREDGGHMIAGSSECPLLKSDVQPLDGKDGLWIPDEQAGATLSGLLGPMKEDQFLFDALFETGTDDDSEEQKLDLGEGYRGRPHIGAAVMSVKANAPNAFWDAITETFNSAGMAGNARILIVGSVFGGTGAAGFPTIARMIRSRLNDAKIKRNVDIGGVLMLPYFGYPDPSADQDQNVARAHEQQMQAHGALQHYQHMLGSENSEDGQHIFDQLFLIGWNPFFRIDVHSKGSGKQRNPALLPEFLAAAAAAKFFSSDTLPEEEVTQNITVSARRELKAIDWPDFPSVTGDEAETGILHDHVARFLRFAVAFKFWKPQIDKPVKRNAVKNQAWFKTQQLDKIDWSSESPAHALDQLEVAIDNALGWFASIDAYSRRDAEQAFRLWNVGSPLVSKIDFSTLDEDPKVERGLAYDDYKRLFNSIVTKYNANDDEMPDMVELADNLTDYETEDQHKMMGRFIAALYHFSDVRSIAAKA